MIRVGHAVPTTGPLTERRFLVRPPDPSLERSTDEIAWTRRVLHVDGNQEVVPTGTWSEATEQPLELQFRVESLEGSGSRDRSDGWRYLRGRHTLWGERTADRLSPPKHPRRSQDIFGERRNRSAPILNLNGVARQARKARSGTRVTHPACDQDSTNRPK